MLLNLMSNEPAEEQPLSLTNPKCYQLLVDQFAAYHLHSYDVMASQRIQEDSILLILRYGEGMKQMNQQLFPKLTFNHGSDELKQFYEDTAQACKKTLIAEYYQMIKP